MESNFFSAWARVLLRFRAPPQTELRLQPGSHELHNVRSTAMGFKKNRVHHSRASIDQCISFFPRYYFEVSYSLRSKSFTEVREIFQQRFFGTRSNVSLR